MFAQTPTATGAWDLISSRIPLLGTLTVWAVAIQVTILIFLIAYKSVKSRGGGGGGMGLSQMKGGKVLMGIILLLNIPVAMQAIDWISILVGTTVGNELNSTSPIGGVPPADAGGAGAPAGAEAGGG